MAAAALACSCWVRPVEKNGGSEAAGAAVEQSGDELAVTLESDETVDGVRVIKVKTCEMVCSTSITISLKDGIIQNVAFENGCPGNTLGVATLAKGMTVEEAISRLDGTPCASKPTSCPDQLARALKLSLQRVAAK